MQRHVAVQPNRHFGVAAGDLVQRVLRQGVNRGGRVGHRTGGAPAAVEHGRFAKHHARRYAQVTLGAAVLVGGAEDAHRTPAHHEEPVARVAFGEQGLAGGQVARLQVRGDDGHLHRVQPGQQRRRGQRHFGHRAHVVVTQQVVFRGLDGAVGVGPVRQRRREAAQGQRRRRAFSQPGQLDRDAALARTQHRVLQGQCAGLVDGAHPPQVQHEAAATGAQGVGFVEQPVPAAEEQRAVQLEHHDAVAQRPQPCLHRRRVDAP